MSSTIVLFPNLSHTKENIVAQPAWLKKYLVMKPEVKQIFNDLEAWSNYCKNNMIKFDEADLYKSQAYRDWQERRNRRREQQ